MWLVGWNLFFVMSKYLQSNEWCWEKRSPLYKITVSVEINIYLTAELTSKKSWTVSVYCNLKNISRNGGINWRQKNKRVQSRYYLLFPSWQGNLAPQLVLLLKCARKNIMPSFEAQKTFKQVMIARSIWKQIHLLGLRIQKKTKFDVVSKKGEFSSCEKTSSNFSLWAPYVKNIIPQNIFSCAYDKREWEESMRLQNFTTVGKKHWAP